jgi:peptide/nickel transport system substrate-binding protein
LRLAVASPPEALDPRFATSAVAMRLSALVAPPLFVIGEDLRPQPWLAESVEQPTPTSWVVKLREGLRFHDGAPVTSDDVKWTFDSMLDPANGSPHRGKLVHLREVVAVDERTVRFELDAPWAPFLVDANAYGILSKRSCASGCRHAPVGAGPFRVARALDDDETLALTAVDPSAGIQRIEVKVARDATTRLLELMDERIDLVVGDLAPTDLEVLAREDALAIESAPGLGFTYLAFNVRGSPHDETLRALADPRVRRALAMAIDVDTVIATKLRGRAKRASGMIPEGHWAKPASDVVLPYDPAHARALLQESGFSGFHLVLSTTSERARRSVAVVFAEYWRAIGVDVEVRVKDWAALYEDIQSGAFHAFSAKWVPVLEPDLMSWVYSSTNIPAKGKAGGNRGGFVDHELDGWLAAAQSTNDVDERRALYARASLRVAEQLPVVPLWFEDEVAVRTKRVEGFRLARTGALLPIMNARVR